MLRGLRLGFEKMSRELARENVESASIRSEPDRPSWPSGGSQTEDSVSSVGAVAGGIADLEHSIAVHGSMRNWFRKWLRFHQVIFGVLGVLLALHVWSGVYYGLRWFQ